MNRVPLSDLINQSIDMIERALGQAGIDTFCLSEKETDTLGKVSLGAMHAAKGLEFKAVLIFGISASSLSSPRIRSIPDPLDRDRAFEQGRRLLYVAMTRASDLLTVTWSESFSPFIESLGD